MNPSFQLNHIVGLCSLCVAHLVSAQSPAPGGNPFNTLPQPQSPRPELPPPPALSGNLGLTQSSQLPTGLAMESEVLAQRIDISGVHALPFEAVAALFEPFSGKTVTIAQLALAVQQATLLYQQSGYLLSFVYLPTQSFEQGVVKIQAVEGHIQRVTVVGDTGKSGALLDDLAQPIAQSQPLEGEIFNRQTLLMARMLSLQVSAQAALPTTTDGGTDLVLNVRREPVLFNIGADLRQGDPKAIANLTLNDPLWGGSQWQFSSLLDDPKDERFVSASWNQWLNAQGTTLRTSISDFKGKDSFSGSSILDTTTQRKAEVSVMHPLSISATGSTLVGASIFGLNYAKQYQFPSLGLGIFDREKVRAIQAHIIWQKIGPQSLQNANATLTQGVNALGAGSERTADLPANAAKFNFTRLSFDYAFRWRFHNRVGAAMGIGGQYASDALPTSERVSFGGARYGRGYRAGESAGDKGLGSYLEINREFLTPERTWIKSWEPYLLYEYAKTWFYGSQIAGQNLRSTSLGMRFGDNRHYALDLSVSKPQGYKSSYNPAQKVRYSLNLTYQF
jgi:hemolysin activation/secretion protein